MSNFEAFTCPCCSTEFLVDYKERTFEMLGIAEPEEGDEEFVYDDETPYEDDEVDYEPELEITAEGEPGLENINYTTTYKSAYEAGSPVTPGEVTTKKDGKVIVENEPPTGNGSGIRVETTMNDAKPQPRVRQQKKHGKMQPMGEFNNVVRPKGRCENREGFEVTGGDATQDFTGLTGADAHFDNLLQQAYESDLADRGF